MDYEHIPFRCRICHEYCHLYIQCPLNVAEETSRKQEEGKRRKESTEGGEESFQEIPKKRRTRKEMTRTQQPVKAMSVECPNKFKVLQEEEGETEKVENMEEPMDIIKDTKRRDLNLDSMVGGGTEDNMDMTVEQPQTEIDTEK